MAITNLYKTLFKLDFFHHYFLDEGENVFDPNDAMPPLWQTNNLGKYKFYEYFDIVPTAKTRKLLKNWKAIYRLENDGIRVVIKVLPAAAGVEPRIPFIDFSDDFVMDFLIEVKDNYFENYTDIIWDKNKMVMISNKSPILDVIDPPINEGDPIPTTVNFSYLSSYETQTAGIDYNIDLLKDINPRELIGKFGLIRMHLQGDTAGSLDEIVLTNGTGDKLATATPNPRLLLKNRSTFWRYFNNSDGTPIAVNNDTNNNALPLVENGYVQAAVPGGSNAQKLPNPSPNIIIQDAIILTKFYSEIYI